MMRVRSFGVYGGCLGFSGLRAHHLLRADASLSNLSVRPVYCLEAATCSISPLISAWPWTRRVLAIWTRTDARRCEADCMRSISALSSQVKTSQFGPCAPPPPCHVMSCRVKSFKVESSQVYDASVETVAAGALHLRPAVKSIQVGPVPFRRRGKLHCASWLSPGDPGRRPRETKPWRPFFSHGKSSLPAVHPRDVAHVPVHVVADHVGRALEGLREVDPLLNSTHASIRCPRPDQRVSGLHFLPNHL